MMEMFRAGLQRKGICHGLLAMEYVLFHLGVTREDAAFAGQMWDLLNKSLVNCDVTQDQGPHGGCIRHKMPGEKKIQEDTVT